jgi:hypothetical protein
MLDIKPLCNIKAGHEVPRLLNEYVGKVGATCLPASRPRSDFMRTFQLILASIPALERENFCNGSSTPDLGNELQSIAAQGRKFLEWAALAQLAVALAQDTSIDEDIRKHIAIHRAEGFVAMCLARQLPPSGAVDPVTWSGWDRTSDAGTLDNLQNECAAVTDSCLRLAYRSQLGPFLGDPKAWYTRAVQFLTGPSYTNILGLITCAGPENVTQELWEWNLKLTVLREAAGKIEGVLEPQEVLDSLCNDIGISAVNAAACDDSTKEQVRQVNLTTLPFHRTAGSPAVYSAL